MPKTAEISAVFLFGAGLIHHNRLAKVHGLSSFHRYFTKQPAIKFHRVFTDYGIEVR